MSQKQASPDAPPAVTPLDPDAMEVAPGAARENLEGSVPVLASPEELRCALESAFSYRGDVLITRKDASQVDGYIFDRQTGQSLTESFVRILPKNGGPKISICYADIAGLVFSGRDPAAGKNWESWVRKYWQKKQAGEEDISLHPEKLD